MHYAYPLRVHFRFLALAPRIRVTDAQGKELLYIEQKMFALKEAIKVFDNSQNKKLLYTIHANQIIDFGAKYLFSTSNNRNLGSVQQDGLKSLFQASYAVHNAKEEPVYKVIQTNPLIAILDSLLSMIPFAELFTGFILHPSFSLLDPKQEKPIMTMKKKPSFLESEFEIVWHNEISRDEEIICLLTLLMIVQLERRRG